MSGNLDGFLDRGSEAADARPEPAAPPPPPPEQQPAKPSEQPAEPSEPEDDGEGEQASGPFAALKDERQKRRDWRDRAVRFETERDELRKQLEEAKRAAAAQQPPPQQYQMPPPIDPVEDPQGFMQRLQEVRARDEVNNRLNNSEMLLRRDIGGEAVEALQNEFRAMAKDDPGLIGKLHSQLDPYSWLKQEVEAQRVLREVRTDPSAYEAKLRAKWEAERAAADGGEMPQQQAPGAYASRPSLANARSAAPRSAPVFSGPTPMGDILRRG